MEQRSFWRFSFRKSTLLKELASLDSMDEGGSLDEGGKARKLEILGDLAHLIKLEETSWRQKLGSLWLKEGDRCTNFFHL